MSGKLAMNPKLYVRLISSCNCEWLIDIMNIQMLPSGSQDLKRVESIPILQIQFVIMSAQALK